MACRHICLRKTFRKTAKNEPFRKNFYTHPHSQIIGRLKFFLKCALFFSVFAKKYQDNTLIFNILQEIKHQQINLELRFNPKI